MEDDLQKKMKTTSTKNLKKMEKNEDDLNKKEDDLKKKLKKI